MNESAGIALKRHLGLMAFPIVKYARLIGVGGLKVYFVFFDSRMPTAVFTTWQTFGREFPTVVAFAHKGTRLNMTPLVPIEEWKGTEQDSLFIRVDMSGRFAEPKSYGMHESTGADIRYDVAIDFDGVINSYTSGWQGATATDPPVQGAAIAIKALLNAGKKLVIYSTRAADASGIETIRKYLYSLVGVDASAIAISYQKPIANIYLDDRAVTFNGDWDEALQKIATFTSYLDKPAGETINEFIARSNTLVEDLTLDDFKNPDAIDAMTQKFRTIRRKRLGKETMRVKLVNVRWSTARDWVEFAFKSMSTPNAAPPKGATPTAKGQGVWDPKKRTSPSPSAHFALVPNKPKVYNLLIRLDKFFTWMLDTLPDGQQLTMKDISDAIKVCPVRFWSDCPAWHWQGLNYNMSQMGCSLRPTNIAPQYWNQPHLHGPSGMLDKHLGALVRNISFFTNQMAAMLNSRLTKAGVISGTKYNFQ